MADVYKKLRGLINRTIFKVGTIQVKDNSGVAELRNTDDSAYVITRGLDPVGSNDFVTKSYGDTNYGGGVQVISFPFALAATTDSTTTIPANSIVYDAWIIVVAQYSVGGTISLGHSGNTSLLQTTSDNDPQTATANDIFSVPQYTDWGGSALAVRVTVGGGPAAGSGRAVVFYGTPKI